MSDVRISAVKRAFTVLDHLNGNHGHISLDWLVSNFSPDVGKNFGSLTE
jgi:hypothetical protein